MNIEQLTSILDQFLDRWTLENVDMMSLQEYVGLKNKDTFCQWVETKTRIHGSIKGMTSIKFGIYQRKEQIKKPRNYINDEEYSWLRGYGDDRSTAFDNVKRDIIKIIQLSEVGEFEQIDNLILPDLFKWKVAFLYSNERLIPIFKRDVLFRIAEHFGLVTNRDTTISQIQNVMMLNKPAHLDVYSFMRQLYDRFGKSEDMEEVAITIAHLKEKIRSRRPARGRNTEEQVRTVAGSYVAQQKHNKIQETLFKMLSDEYGNENVILEENYVDIKLFQKDYITFYEVKSSSYASDCIREALGQILLYSLNDIDDRPKKHIVVGQYPATDNDKKYIDFLKKNLKLEFDYINVPIG